MDTFNCGHFKTPENSAPNGAASVICRECKNARRRKAYKNNPEIKSKGKYRQRKHRGGLKGNFCAQKTHCPKGHPFDEENTYHYKGMRQCKKCRISRTNIYFNDKRSNGGSHSEEEWQALCEEYGNQCLRCKRANITLTKDHVIPVSKGGTNDIGNLQPLCHSCNASKKDKHIDYRLDYVKSNPT